jgi:hypothetical protein
MNDDEAETIPIEVDWASEPTTVYANGAHLVHTEREFAIAFTEFASFDGRAASLGSRMPRARVAASVRLTPDVFFQFVAGCASNWNKYAEEHGATRAPRFHLVEAPPPEDDPETKGR